MAEASARTSSRRGITKSAAAFRTISEVAGELDVPQHVLRFWESKFSQIKPLKRGGGRRYYRPEDIDLLRSIRELLYTEGYTIRGVQKLLREGGIKSLSGLLGQAKLSGRKAKPAGSYEGGLSARQRQTLNSTLDELEAAKKMLSEGSQ